MGSIQILSSRLLLSGFSTKIMYFSSVPCPDQLSTVLSTLLPPLSLSLRSTYSPREHCLKHFQSVFFPPGERPSFALM